MRCSAEGYFLPSPFLFYRSIITTIPNQNMYCWDDTFLYMLHQNFSGGARKRSSTRKQRNSRRKSSSHKTRHNKKLKKKSFTVQVPCEWPERDIYPRLLCNIDNILLHLALAYQFQEGIFPVPLKINTREMYYNY